jgi:hypothetical protein
VDIGWLKWAGQAAIGFLGGVAAYFALPKLLGSFIFSSGKNPSLSGVKTRLSSEIVSQGAP